MQTRLGARSIGGELAEPRAAFARGDRSSALRRAVPMTVGAAAFSIVALTAATALPSSAPSDPPTPFVAPQPAPLAYLGAAAAPQSAPDPSPAAEDSSEMRFTGRIGENLTQSLQAAGVPERQGREYVWLLGKAITLADGLSVDDRFDLVIERGTDGKPGQLVYAGLDRVGRADVELLKWTDGKRSIWVNADGVGGQSSAAMRLPVSGRVTSGFGSRFHPILGYARMHKGVDLAGVMGAPIAAAADGRVVSAGWRGGYGRQVVIAHNGGIQTLYAHMSRMAAYPGEMVRQGQIIGYVGSSGLSTGPHVHFEVLKGGRPVNPMSAKLSGGPGQLEGEKLHQFHDALRALLMLRAS